MIRKLLLGFAKGLVREVADDIVAALVNELQEEVAKIPHLNEREKAVAQAVCDLLEARAVAVILAQIDKL